MILKSAFSPPIFRDASSCGISAATVADNCGVEGGWGPVDAGRVDVGGANADHDWYPPAAANVAFWGKKLGVTLLLSEVSL